MSRWMGLSLLLLSTLLVACGGTGGGSASTSASPSGPIQVVTQNLRFVPDTLTVKAGQKVTMFPTPSRSKG